MTGAAGKELCHGDENSWLFSSNPLVFFRIFQPQFSQEESFSTTYSLLFAGRVLLLSQVLVSFQMPSLLLRTWQAVPVKLTGQQDLPATVFPTLPLLKNLPNLQNSFLPHTPVLPTLQSSFFNTAFPSTSTELELFLFTVIFSVPHAAADYHPRTQNSEKPDPQVDIVCQTCSTVEPVVTWVFIPELVNFLRVLSCERQVQLGVTAVANL